MKRVLFVDDLIEIRRAMKRMLTVAGYHVTLADNGQVAYEAATQGLPFDLLVTDLNMPEMMGDELIRRLRDAGFSQPMLVYTSAPGAVAQCGHNGVYDKTQFQRLLADLPHFLTD
jgi:CheY-like chemotaxis protein